MPSTPAAPSGPPLRLGVIGLGRAFTLMLPTLLQDRRIQLVAACDPREAVRLQFRRDFGAPVFSDAAPLLALPEVEAVYIASPHQHHLQHTRAAAAQGKHVLLEKPMATTLDDCSAMIEACASAGVQLIVGHCHSFDTPYLRSRELIVSGELGRVRMIQAINHTDWLYRPRRPEELDSAAGGGVVFSQGAHQVDVVRLLAGSRAVRVRSVLGRWDEARPTEGAYSALIWFEDGAFANLSYCGYGHFDSDEWCGGIGELGQPKRLDQHGQARRRLAQAVGAGTGAQSESDLKSAATYGGPAYHASDASAQRPSLAFAHPAPGAAVPAAPPPQHQHFGAVLINCEHGAIRPMSDGLWIYGDAQREHRPLPPPAVPRFEVIDELIAAVHAGRAPLHDGVWARATIEVCQALQASARGQCDVGLHLQVGPAA